MKQCVVCRTATEQRQHERVTADVCPDGHGLWLLERELLMTLRDTDAGDLPVGTSYDEGRSLRLAADRDIRTDDADRDCPMCERAMGSVEFGFTSGVTVDVCSEHGVWLDAGELETLEAAAERRADSTTPEGAVRSSRIDAIREATANPNEVSWRLSFGDVVRALLGRR